MKFPIRIRKLSRQDSASTVFLAVFLAPIVLFWAFVHFYKPISPFFEAYDPEFAYLMNSLEVFKGHPYVYVDHPGTPVEVLGTVIYALIYPFLHLTPSQFIVYNLENPGPFLNVGHAVLTLASIACAVVFFRVAMPAKLLRSSLFAAALATSYFALHPQSFRFTSIWSHNSFAFPVGTLLLVLLFRSLNYEPRHDIPTRQLVMLGLGAGVFSAITIFFASWIGGMVLAVLTAYRLGGHAWKRTIGAVLVLGGSSVVGFFLAVLPVLRRIRYSYGFIRSLLLHKQEYLGLSGSSTLDSMSRNLQSLVRDAPVLAIITGVALVLSLFAVAFWRRRLAAHPGAGGTVYGLSIQAVLLSAFLLNDYSLRYFLALAAIIPVLVMALWQILGNDRPAGRAVQYAVILLVSTGLVAGLWNQVSFQRDFSALVAQRTVQQRTAIAQYAQTSGKPRDEMVVIWSYGTYNRCVSLWFGNSSAGHAFNEEVASICPDFYYSVFSGGVTYLANKSGNIKIDTAKPFGDLNWDVYLGCPASFLESLGPDQTQYAVVIPTPPSPITCSASEGGVFGFVYKK